MAPKFSRFKEDLLLALADARDTTTAHFIDAVAVAKQRGLIYQPGWVREAVHSLENSGLLRAAYMMGGGPEGNISAQLTGNGLERIEEIAERREREAYQSEQSQPLSRHVVVDKASADYLKAVAALKDVIAAVRGNNEYANTEPEDYGQRIAELEAAERLLQAPRIDLAWLKPKLIATLKYLGEKFADNLINIAVGAAIGAFVTFFS